MTLRDYLAKINARPSPWAESIGIPSPIILRFLQGKRNLSFKTAAKIVRATGGLVSFEDLLPPEARIFPRVTEEGNGTIQK